MAFDVISMDPKYWYDKMIRELEQEIGETLYPIQVMNAGLWQKSFSIS